MDATEIKHVECTPGTCGGAPRVAGTRIRVSQIVLLTEQGESPDEIVAAFPHLTLADVHAALAYYHDHRIMIEEEIDNADAEFARLIQKSQTKRQDGHGPSISSR